MAQTKRKRRTKHRGNAAGVVESRGRTGRAPTPQEKKAAARGNTRRDRVAKPPNWKSAASKALVMSVLLFVLTRVGLFGRHVPVTQSLVLAVFAVVLYTPLAYVTDKWVYQRQQRRLTGNR